MKWGGFAMTIFGAIALVVCLIMFGIAMSSLDSAMTSAASYTEMTSLTSIMGIWGLVLFIVFMVLGLGAIGGGAYMNIHNAMGSDSWTELLMIAIMGGVTIVIALVMNGVALSQLHAAYVTVNALANKASFTGLLSIMGIFGMVIFLALMASGIASLGGAGIGGWKKLQQGF